MEQSKFLSHLNLVPVGLGLLLTTSACTKSGGGNANVTFTLPAGISASSSGLHMMTAETSSALNCYFITVGGPEAQLSNNTCQDAGATVAPFNIGIIAGGFSQGSTGTLSVPAGQNRSFSVMGFSSTGSCPSLASLMSSGSSTTVYFLGQTTGVNLSAGETAAVNISVPSQYDNVNNVVSCAGPLFPNGGGNSTPSQLAVVLQDSLTSATAYNSATCVPAYIVVQNSSGSGASVSSDQYSLQASLVSGNISSPAPAYSSVFTDNACTSAWTSSNYTNGNTQSVYIQTPAASTTGTISFGAEGTPALNPIVSTFTTRTSNYVVNDIALVSSTLQNSKMVTIGSSTSIPAWQCEAMSAQIQDSLGVPTPANGTTYTLGGSPASGVTYYTDQFCSSNATANPSSSSISGLTTSTASTQYFFRLTTNSSPTWGFSGTNATFSIPTVTVSNYTASPTTTALVMPNSGFSTPGTSLKIPAGTCAQVELAFVDSSGSRGSFKINSGGGGYYASTAGIFFSNSSCSAIYDLNSSNGLFSATMTSPIGFVTMWVLAPAAGTTVTSQLAFCGNSGLTTTPSTGFMSSTQLTTGIGSSLTACYGSPHFYEQANVPTFSITGQ